MRKLILTTLIALLCFVAVAQKESNPKRKAIYAELLGSGVFGSVNYDFRFTEKENGLGLRLGVGMIPDVLVIPLDINGLIGDKRTTFEYGIGISNGIFLAEKSDNQSFSTGLNRIGFIGYAKAGIRIKPKTNGLVFNFNWNPIINTEEIRWIWFGIGIGYSWK